MDEKILYKAIGFARKAHEGQMYSEVYTYVRHLEMVYDVLVDFGFTDETLLISAWLHDVIEDTDISYQDVKREFGKDVAEVVYGVTDELGRNRKEKKAKTYPKIRENIKSLILKLADRIANVKFGSCGVFGNPSKLDMYRKEQPEFEKELGYPELSNKLMHVSTTVAEREDDTRLFDMWHHLRQLLK